MKKLLKSSVILIIISLFCLNFNVFAVEEANNTVNNEKNTAITATNEANATKANATKNETTEASNTSTQVSSIASVDESSLKTADIINIFLIAVCIILILLAIAILIRLK